MTEEAATYDTGLATEAPDQALTIARKRLANNAECLNCGTGLQGPFCHYCGQPDRNFLRFFPALLRDMLEDFLDFDSRFIRTMKPLLFRPGKLTRDFLDGRRFRYTPPLRLYIFSSVVFFLLVTFASSFGLITYVDENPETEVQRSDLPAGAEGDALAERLRGLDVEVVDDTVPSDPDAEPLPPAEPAPEAAAEDDDSEFRLQFGAEEWDRETNPLIIPLMPDRFNNWVNDQLAESPRKVDMIHGDPAVMANQVFDVLPVVMFILLPVVALVFKFFYLFSKRYYVEHLIFSLHNHSFVFVIFTGLAIMEILEHHAIVNEISALGHASNVVAAVLVLWIPTYLFLSMKRVYQQGWILTMLKFGAISIINLVILMFISIGTAFIAFLRV